MRLIAIAATPFAHLCLAGCKNRVAPLTDWHVHPGKSGQYLQVLRAFRALRRLPIYKIDAVMNRQEPWKWGFVMTRRAVHVHATTRPEARRPSRNIAVAHYTAHSVIADRITTAWVAQQLNNKCSEWYSWFYRVYRSQDVKVRFFCWSCTSDPFE